MGVSVRAFCPLELEAMIVGVRWGELYNMRLVNPRKEFPGVSKQTRVNSYMYETVEFRPMFPPCGNVMGRYCPKNLTAQSSILEMPVKMRRICTSE
jgi:hypothetical protein